MIADISYYNSLGFKEAGEEEVRKALERAEGVINLLTGSKCREFSALHEEAQTQLKYAICAQAEWYIINGYNEGEIDCKVKIGDFSYESKSGGVLENIAPLAQAALKISGLLYAGTEAV